MTSKIDFTEEDLYKADLMAFGSEIGAITNKSTSMYAMLPLYEPDSEQYKELERRLIMTRVAQGNAIDKAKGVKTKQFPKHWANYQRISPDDTDEIKERKEFFNSILVEKKPYFFKYLYKDSRNAYSKFLKEEESYRKIYGIDFDTVMNKPKEERTKEEQYYVDSYWYRNPLIESDCEMNRICKYLESVDFEIKKNIQSLDNSIYKLYMKDNIEFNQARYNKVKQAVKSFFKYIKDDMYMSDYIESARYLPEEENIVFNKYDAFKENMNLVCSNTIELTNYLVLLFYTELQSYNKDVLWKCYGKTMFTNVLDKSSKHIMIPHLDDKGEYSYLFDNYNIVEADLIG